MVGIEIKEQEESYTSKASFLDLDLLPVYKRGIVVDGSSFSGMRVSRGLYRCKVGLLINSDVNGSYNILRKELFNKDIKLSLDDIKVLSVIPVRVKSTNEFHVFV